MSVRDVLCDRAASQLEELAQRLRARTSDTAIQAVVIQLDSVHHTLTLCLSSVRDLDRPRPDV